MVVGQAATFASELRQRTRPRQCGLLSVGVQADELQGPGRGGGSGGHAVRKSLEAVHPVVHHAGHCGPLFLQGFVGRWHTCLPPHEQKHVCGGLGEWGRFDCNAQRRVSTRPLMHLLHPGT
jgi:hypothetical protein